MRLDSDNPETMPITDAVYGTTRKGGKPGKENEPRGHTTPIWQRLDISALDDLARVFPGARRSAARARKEKYDGFTPKAAR